MDASTSQKLLRVLGSRIGRNVSSHWQTACNNFVYRLGDFKRVKPQQTIVRLELGKIFSYILLPCCQFPQISKGSRTLYSFVNCNMTSAKMFFALPVLVLLQVLGVNASFGDVVFPRSEEFLAWQDSEDTGLAARAAPAACSFFFDAIEFCSSVSPGWISMAPSRQATCLCYSSTSWAPTLFDGAASTCASYAKTADPADYSVISELQGFCSSVGNVKPASISVSTTRLSASSAFQSTSVGSASSPLITSAPKTSSTTLNPGCSTVDFALSYCSSVSPGFLSMDVSEQAPCLCYSSSSFNPAFFDSAVQTCANYVSTAAPDLYTDISALEKFCSSAGDVLHASSIGVPSGSPVTNSAKGSSTPLTGNGNGNTPGAVPAPSTAPATAGNGGPVTVTAGGGAATASPTRTSGASELMVNWALGMGSVAFAMVVFL